MNIEDIGLKYKPHNRNIEILIVGESPSERGTFFYAGTNSMRTHFRKVFEEAFGITFDNDTAFLNFMKRTGVYLDDLCLEPINKMDKPARKVKHNDWTEDLAKRISLYKPNGIIACLLEIEKPVRNAIIKSGTNPKYEAVPFPGQSHQTRFKNQMIDILKKWKFKERIKMDKGDNDEPNSTSI